MATEANPTEPLATSATPACPYCGCTAFFSRKHFPQTLGIILVVGTAAAFMILASNPATFSIGLWLLIGMTIFDYTLYMLLPKVAACYRCRQNHPDRSLAPRVKPFDLSTSEKYRVDP